MPTLGITRFCVLAFLAMIAVGCGSGYRNIYRSASGLSRAEWDTQSPEPWLPVGTIRAYLILPECRTAACQSTRAEVLAWWRTLPLSGATNAGARLLLPVQSGHPNGSRVLTALAGCTSLQRFDPPNVPMIVLSDQPITEIGARTVECGSVRYLMLERDTVSALGELERDLVDNRYSSNSHFTSWTYGLHAMFDAVLHQFSLEPAR